MPSITSTSYLEVSKLGAQQQRKNRYDFTVYPTFRLTWKARIGWIIYAFAPSYTYCNTHLNNSINNNFKRIVPIRYHISHNVPCYTHRFAIKITTYNISKLIVYKYDINEWKLGSIHVASSSLQHMSGFTSHLHIWMSRGRFVNTHEPH